MPVPKISHDWYQTETQVVVEVRIKKLKADKCKIEIGETNLSVTAPLPTGSEYSLELDLAHPVVPAQSAEAEEKREGEAALNEMFQK